VKRDSGFTLLEVLMALTVMAVGVTLILSLISGSLSNIRKVRGNAHLIEHAQAVMELALLDDSIQAATSMRGDFEDGTRWSVEVSEVEMPAPPSAVPMSQQIQLLMPKMFSYVVVVMGPNSNKADFQLQTLKMVTPQPQVQGGRVSR
jgi:prepilin-type N-terminal cleavage/methylation domain-containing protein